jgi:hypothetical protein
VNEEHEVLICTNYAESGKAVSSMSSRRRLELSDAESEGGEGMGDDDFESFLRTQETLKKLGRKPRSTLQGTFTSVPFLVAVMYFVQYCNCPKP